MLGGKLFDGIALTMFCDEARNGVIAHLRACEKCRNGVRDMLTAFPLFSMGGPIDIDKMLDAIEKGMHDNAKRED